MQIPLKHPQEIEVWYVLPAIRRELVLVLKQKGFNQKVIAGMLNVTEPAVSQYLNSKRAKEIKFPKDVTEVIKESAEKIKCKTTAYQQIQQISNYVRETKALCRIHIGMEEGLESCDICFQKEIF